MKYLIRKYHLIIIALICITCFNIYSQDLFKVERLPFNSKFDNEMAPFIYNGGIIFSSNRKSNYIATTTDLENKLFYNLFYTVEKSNGKWVMPKIFAEELYTVFHEGPTAISYDGKTIFYTRTLDIETNISEIDLDSVYKLGIFYAKLINNQWTDIKSFPFNNELYNTAFPSISKNGKILLFCSDKPEGYGGYDIYASVLDGDTWQEPVNLGPVINTDTSEVFPFFHENGNLYFSSKGHGSIGGLDIFVSRLVGKDWKRPEPLQRPINSEYDDFGFVVNPTVDTGYFTSNRDKTDDIYKFNIAYPRLTDCPDQQKNNYCFVFYEEGNIDLDTTTLSYEWDMGDGTLIRKLEAEHCFKGPGEYIIKLNVIDTLTGEVYYNEASYDFPIEDIKQAYIEVVDTCKINDFLKINSYKTNLENFIIEDQYWYLDNKFLGVGPELDYKITTPGVYYLNLGLLGKKDKGSDVELKCVKKPIVVIK